MSVADQGEKQNGMEYPGEGCGCLVGILNKSTSHCNIFLELPLVHSNGLPEMMCFECGTFKFPCAY